MRIVDFIKIRFQLMLPNIGHEDTFLAGSQKTRSSPRPESAFSISVLVSDSRYRFVAVSRVVLVVVVGREPSVKIK